MSAAPSTDLLAEAPHAKAPHERLMDQVYRRQRYLYDFTRKYYLFGRDRLIRDLSLKDGERLVEIGCGTARNLIAIARAHTGARLYGLDASAEMLKTARAAVRRAGLEDRIVLRQGLAEALDPALFGTDGFENAMFSYSLSMIPDWRAALAAAVNVLPENGSVHIVDFGDLAALPGWARHGLRAWLALFHVAPRDEVLRVLERQTLKNSGLRLLPGRYAFTLSAQKCKMGTFLAAVAMVSQGPGKTLN